MMIRLDRNRRGPDRTLDHRMTVFVLGAVIALIGISSGNRIIVYVAIAILVVGMVLRVAGSRRRDGGDDHGDQRDD